MEHGRAGQDESGSCWATDDPSRGTEDDVTTQTQDVSTAETDGRLERAMAFLVVVQGMSTGLRAGAGLLLRGGGSVRRALGFIRGNRFAQGGLVFLGASTITWLAGLALANKLTQGDEDSDDFQLASIMGGKEFHSHAQHLRSGTVITSLGGIELDLREATLDPSGANLELRTTMGGVEVRVPQYWVVEVDQDALGGELQVDVTSAEDLPEDAPQLHIHAVTRIGGGLVTAKAG